jgi:ATP-dependent Clp protease ATP-binding subunit ClpA
MFDRYTADARQVIFLARYEASRLGASELAADHLWLGLLRQSPKLIRRHAPQVTADIVQSRLPALDPEAPRVSMTVELPLSAEAAEALAGAAALADSHGQTYITPEYLILALVATHPAA